MDTHAEFWVTHQRTVFFAEFACTWNFFQQCFDAWACVHAVSLLEKNVARLEMKPKLSCSLTVHMKCQVAFAWILCLCVCSLAASVMQMLCYRIQSLESMLTEVSLSASAEARASTPTVIPQSSVQTPDTAPGPSHSPSPPYSAPATAAEMLPTSGPLVKLQRTATKSRPAQEAPQAAQPDATAVDSTASAESTAVADDNLGPPALQPPALQHLEAAEASVISQD